MKRKPSAQPGLFEREEFPLYHPPEEPQPWITEPGAEGWIKARAAVLEKIRGMTPGGALAVARIDFEEGLTKDEMDEQRREQP